MEHQSKNHPILQNKKLLSSLVVTKAFTSLTHFAVIPERNNTPNISTRLQVIPIRRSSILRSPSLEWYAGLSLLSILAWWDTFLALFLNSGSDLDESLRLSCEIHFLTMPAKATGKYSAPQKGPHTRHLKLTGNKAEPRYT